MLLPHEPIPCRKAGAIIASCPSWKFLSQFAERAHICPPYGEVFFFADGYAFQVGENAVQFILQGESR